MGSVLPVWVKIHSRGVVRDSLGEDILAVLEGKGLPFLAKEDAVTEPVLDEAFGVLPSAQWGYESFIGIDLENFEIVQIASNLSLRFFVNSCFEHYVKCFEVFVEGPPYGVDGCGGLEVDPAQVRQDFLASIAAIDPAAVAEDSLWESLSWDTAIGD